MEYGATVLDPYQKYISDKVERVQHWAARFVKSRYSRYSSQCFWYAWCVGDRRLNLFCFTKLFTVWHKCSSKASLLRCIRVLEENTIWNLDRLDSRFFLKLLEHGTGLLSLKLCHWLYLDHIFLTNGVHPFRTIP